MTDINRNLADNIRRLRETRKLSQAQLAKLSGIPRPTWASLETGTANPTLAVLSKAATALNISIEELVGPPRSEFKFIPAARVPERKRQGARIRPLVAETIAGLEITRTELEAGGRMVGIPHKEGTREYLTCERGQVELVAGGKHHLLNEGDMLVFRGDQRHSYINPDMQRTSISVSVVCFAS
ncbi:MAG: transcriptional regulator with XRE-family HTH domain [Halieaceae bacterium]|jgi:transcriptional regulator with XRE-family HTH domain